MGDLCRLPLEIRQMIYAECLVVGTVSPYFLRTLRHYSDWWCGQSDEKIARQLSKYNAPEVRLLRVCKAIHQEAEPMLYQRNTFRLPASDLMTRFFERSLHTDARRAMVKSVEMSFHPGDLHEDEGWKDLSKQSEKSRSWIDQFEQECRGSYEELLELPGWLRNASYVFDHLCLDKLVLDFTDPDTHQLRFSKRPAAVMALEQGFAKSIAKSLKLRGLTVEEF